VARGYADVTGVPLDETNLREFYSDYWDSRSDNAIWGPANRHLRRIIRKLLDGIDYRSVLDVGCGVGVLVSELKEAKSDLVVYGLDISAAAIEVANTMVQGDFRTCDVTDGLPDLSVDAVVCCEVLEHLPDDEALLRDLARKCTYLVVEVPAGPLTRTFRQGGHLRHYTVAGLKKMLTQTGFDVLELRKWGFPLLSIYRRVMDTLSESQVLGTYGRGKKLVCQLVYLAYYVNCFNAGDCLFALARSRAKLAQAADGQTSKEP